MVIGLQRLLAAVVVAWTPSSLAAEAPRVVVSIAPVHSLVAGVMAEVSAPRLLLKPTDSEHVYALRPSDARLLADADVVFWVAEELETFLAKPLAALARKARVVALADAPGLRVLAARGTEGDDGDGRSRPTARPPEAGLRRGADMHVWFDPANARAIAAFAAEVLTQADPENAERYARNAARLAQRLQRLEDTLRADLAPVRGRRFAVFHDAFQYFESAFGLERPGFITVSPERPPRARRLRDLRERIAAGAFACVFAELQFEPKLVESLLSGTAARRGVLDPIGVGLEPGPDLYFRLLERNAAALVGCLAGDGHG